MKKIITFLSLMLTLATMAANAQNVTVKGTVKDASNGEALPNASILVKGGATATGVIADLDGNFTITCPANATLLISSIGYKTKEVAADGKRAIVVSLESDSALLEGSVKVGYGSSKKIGNLTGAVTTVKAEVVHNAAAQSPLDLLQGQVAGMQVLSSGGVAGDNSISMKIHGVGSLDSSSEPLFIVDGIQSSSTMVMSLNPNDIQSVTVLKDASSTSIYGSLGANGVVFVTTKAGHFDERATVTVHTQWGLTTLANRQFYENMMTAPELTDFWMRSGIMTASDIDKTYYSKGFNANTKWHKYMQNLTGLQSTNDVTIEGGSQKVSYLVSASQFHQDGATIGNFYDRYTVRANVQAVPKDWLKTGVNLTGYVTKDQSNSNWGDSSSKGGNNYTFGGLSFMLNPLYSPINKETGKVDPEFWGEVGLPNPNYYMSKRNDLISKYGFNGSAFVEIEPYKNLIISSRIGTDSYLLEESFALLPSASWTSTTQRFIGHGISFKNTITNTIEYSANIASAHDFSVLLGQEGIGYKYHSTTTSTMGQTDDRLMSLQFGNKEKDWTASESRSEYAFLSFFGHADYSYQGKYVFDATVRADASSRFGRNHRWAPFWAIGGMWKISSENFMKNVTAVNNLAVKLSYGTQGNAAIGNYDRFGTISQSAQTSYDGKEYRYVSSPENPDLKWEQQNLFTATVEGRFWNRLNAEISAYHRVTKDMLMDVPQPYTSGFTSLRTNVGSMQNTGVDITLGVDILKGRDYSLKFNTTFNYNAEKVTELFNGLKRWEIANTGVAFVVGQPVMYYYPIYAGVDPADGAPMWYLPGEDIDVCTKDPARVTKEFNEETLTQNTGIRRHEPISGGFGLRGNWRGLSFNIDFSYFGGKYLINNDAFFYANPNQFAGQNQSKAVTDFWTPYNTNAKYPNWADGHLMQFDTHLLENASFLRLKNLTIGYALSQKALGSQKVVKGVQFAVTGRNLWTVTNYTGMDPEVDSNLTLGLPGNTLQVLGSVEIKF